MFTVFKEMWTKSSIYEVARQGMVGPQSLTPTHLTGQQCLARHAEDATGT